MGADGCRSRRRGLELRTGVSALQSIGVIREYHTLHGCGGVGLGLREVSQAIADQLLPPVPSVTS